MPSLTPFTAESARNELAAASLGDPQAAQLLRFIGALFMVAGVLVWVINLLSVGQIRLAAPFGVVSGLTAYLLVLKGRLPWAARVLCWSLLAVGPLGAYTTTGLSSPAWGLSATAAMAGGWLLGRSSALALAVVGSLCALGFYGAYPATTPGDATSGEVLLATVLTSLWVGALVGRATASNFMQQQLALLARHRDRLEAANASLEKSDRQLRAVLNHMQGGVCVLDIDTQRAVFVSDGLCQLYGYSREQLMSLPPDSFFPSDKREAMLRRLDLAMLGRVPVEHRAQLRRQDGSVFEADIHHTLVELERRRCLLSMVNPSAPENASPFPQP